MSPRKKSPHPMAPPPRKTSRRWRVPPPLTHGPEALESGSVLEEMASGLGTLLWQSLRDTMLWAGTAPDERARLFAPTAAPRLREMARQLAPPAAVAGPVETLATLLERPEEVGDEAVALACEGVARWAEAEGRLALALSYAQAVALIRAEDARAAYSVGILARRRAEHARAETWFRRAVMLARQSGDWPAYCLAFVGLGKLYVQRGNFPVARKLHQRARRAGRRHGLRELEAMALHDLFVVAANTGEAAEAEGYAEAALEAYGPGHFRLPALAHDVAYFWLERGYHARALPVFEAVLPHIERSADRVRVLADVARAAAGAGKGEVFERAWGEALAEADRPHAEEGEAQALLDLAHGAAMLRRWAKAGRAASRALEIAGARNESKVRLEAEAVLDSVRRRSAAEHAPAAAGGLRGPRGDALASDLVEHLSGTVSDVAPAGEEGYRLLSGTTAHPAEPR